MSRKRAYHPREPLTAKRRSAIARYAFDFLDRNRKSEKTLFQLAIDASVMPRLKLYDTLRSWGYRWDAKHQRWRK